MSCRKIGLVCLTLVTVLGFVSSSATDSYGDAFPKQALAPAPEPDPIVLPVEMNIIKKTNAQRKRFGLRPLKLDLRLMRSARRHATWMTVNHNLQHTSEAVVENIAMGQHDSSQALQDWMNSPGHRANILDPNLTRMGAAAYIASDGTIYWCQQFLR